MTELSPRLGLTIPKADGSDDANLAALLRALGLDAENKAPGVTAMNTATRTGLTGAPMFNGRLVYDTDLSTLFLGDATTWRAVARLDTTGHLPMAGKKVTGLADGTAASDAATKGQLDTAMPIGTVLNYAAGTAPAGWLLCDGAAVSRSTYAALFALIGITYGAGDGTTTFNVPDLRGRTSIGAGSGTGLTARALAATGGTETHQLALSEIPSHAHGGGTGAVGDHTHSYSGSTGAVGDHTHGLVALQDVNLGAPNARRITGGAGTIGDATAPSGAHSHTFSGGTSASGAHSHSIPSDGGGAAHNNMQPFLALAYIIKAT